MGATETMLGTSLAGVLYGLLSAQPVLITGTTGPLLVLEESIFEVGVLKGVTFSVEAFAC